MDDNEIKHFIEAALLAAGRPLSIDQLHNLFNSHSQPEKSQLREAIAALQSDYEHRGLEIVEVASGFRTQIKASMADRLQKLWEERPPRYSRALFETLALIAYRQPMTRGEIEEVRGVAVSSNIIRSLQERDWIRVVGHRDVPGRPAMFGTTKAFLDYFGLKKLDDLPPLADLADWESLRVQLNLPAVTEEEAEPESADVMELPVTIHVETRGEGEQGEPGQQDASDDDGEPGEQDGEPDASAQDEPGEKDAVAQDEQGEQDAVAQDEQGEQDDVAQDEQGEQDDTPEPLQSSSPG